MHFGTYLVVLKYAEIVMVTHISLSIYLHTKQGQRRVLEFGGDEVIILRNILCQIEVKFGNPVKMWWEQFPLPPYIPPALVKVRAA